MTSIEKAGVSLLIGVIILLVLLMVFSKHGLLDHLALQQTHQQILKEALRLEKENSRLEVQIEKLKNDLEYIKHLAKHEHDMAEEDELIFKDKIESKGESP